MTSQISNFLFEYALTIGLVLSIFGLLGLALGFYIYDRRASIKAYLEHRRQVRIQRGIMMGRKQRADRQAYVKGLLADVITNGLEEAWFAGKISEEERNACYRMIGKTHGIPDLLPHLTSAQVKAAIKARRAHGVNTPAQEEPAWGPAPTRPTKPTLVVDNAPTPKRFGEKALKLKSA